ncbi:hypothetical protein ACJ41O_007523 [Fusarium nematophilum]
MRGATIAGILASASLALCLDQQQPLGGHDQAPVSSDTDAPSYRSELLSLHKSLISISSTTGTEHDVGAWLSKYLIGKGYAIEHQELPAFNNTPPGKDRFNVLAWRPSDDFDPKVVLTSHIDVVPPHIPYGIDDGDVTKETMITGRGSVDAKGSVAAQITALEELLRQDKVDPDKLLLVFVVGEEKSGDGMRRFSTALEQGELPYTLDAVIFGEPTENKLACGHKGGLFCNVRTRGFPGHSGYPWLGKSANELMIRAMAKILETDLGSSELFGNTTVNIGSFNGGVAANVIPEEAVVGLAVRVAVGPEATGSKAVHDKIQAIFDEIDEEAFSWECGNSYGAVECNCDVQGEYPDPDSNRSIVDIPGFDTITVNYGTDVPNLKGDHARYLYGPGDILVAHGARENLTVADLETAVEDYQKLVLHALKQ